MSIGSREEEETIAHHLYEVLRDFDEGGCECDLFGGFYTPRMGQAIMNRLLKAAGHKIIKTQEEIVMIALGCDHGGYELKQEIIKYLEEHNLGIQGFRM